MFTISIDQKVSCCTGIFFIVAMWRTLQTVLDILTFLFSFDCQHFGVAEPQFSAAEELKADITYHESMWGLYEEFSTGLDELAKEDWISFRCHYITEFSLISLS